MLITINNSTSSISPINESVNTTLTKLLSYTDKSVEFEYQKKLNYINTLEEDSGEYRKQRYLLKELNAKRKVNLFNNGIFPTGLLGRVKAIADLEGWDISIKDQRIKPKLLQFKFKARFPEFRYYQDKSVELCVKNERGVIEACTGSGKSLIIMKILWELGLSSIIITPSKDITEMFYKNLISMFGKGAVQKLTTKSKKTKPIAIVNIQALVKIDPKLLGKIDCAFIDEFHRSAASTYQEVNENHLKNTYYKFGMTATHFRNDGSDMALEGVLSEVLYKYDYKQAVKDGYLVPVKFNIVQTRCFSNRNYQTEYKKGIVENDSRNLKIIEQVSKHKDKQKIILVQRIEHGDLLASKIKDSVFVCGRENDTFRSKALDDFRKGKLKTLIGIISILGEGVDLPCAEVLIMAGGGKSKSQVMQAVGRILRLYDGKQNGLVIDFTDDGSNHLSQHSLLRQNIYNTEY